jgi:hypothetical protein
MIFYLVFNSLHVSASEFSQFVGCIAQPRWDEWNKDGHVRGIEHSNYAEV